MLLKFAHRVAGKAVDEDSALRLLIARGNLRKGGGHRLFVSDRPFLANDDGYLLTVNARTLRNTAILAGECVRAAERFQYNHLRLAAFAPRA